MLRSTARLDTERSERFLKQLVSHLGHRAETELTQPGSGTVRLEQGGRCALTADPTGIALEASAPDAEALETVQRVVGSHLLRFTDLPALTEDWSPAAAAP